MRRVLKATVAATVFSILPWAHPTVAAPLPKPLFARDDVLHLTLSGPVNRLSRSSSAEPVSARLIVEGEAPESLSFELSVRGNTRRQRETCSFPPLRVEFTEKPAATSIFKGQERLKLVTHCRQQEGFQQYVLLEYIAYRLYRSLTPESFGVRLAQINYVDNDGDPITSRLGFFIEDDDDVAKRNGKERVRNSDHISFNQLNAVSAARFALFEYMIGNLDWSMTTNADGENCCHNARLMGASADATDLTPVPYDFDYSGLVNAPYAVPPANLQLSNARVRRYRGYCEHNNQAQAFARELIERRASLLAILDETPQLAEGTRRRAAEYLGEFFDRIDSPQQFASLMRSCR